MEEITTKIRGQLNLIKVFIKNEREGKRILLFSSILIFISLITKQFLIFSFFLIVTVLMLAAKANDKKKQIEYNIRLLEREEEYLSEEILRIEKLFEFGNPTEEEINSFEVYLEKREEVKRTLFEAKKDKAKFK